MSKSFEIGFMIGIDQLEKLAAAAAEAKPSFGSQVLDTATAGPRMLWRAANAPARAAGRVKQKISDRFPGKQVEEGRWGKAKKAVNDKAKALAPKRSNKLTTV